MSSIVSVPIALFIHNYTPTLFYFCLCLVMAGLLFYFKKRKVAILFFSSFVLTTLTVFLIKITFAVPRSTEALLALDSYAFPSSHAASSMFLATTFSWLLIFHSRLSQVSALSISTLLFIGAIIVGLSRITLLVHTPFQVLVGLILGLAIPIIIISLGKIIPYSDSSR